MRVPAWQRAGCGEQTHGRWTCSSAPQLDERQQRAAGSVVATLLASLVSTSHVLLLDGIETWQPLTWHVLALLLPMAAPVAIFLAGRDLAIWGSSAQLAELQATIGALQSTQRQATFSVRRRFAFLEYRVGAVAARLAAEGPSGPDLPKAGARQGSAGDGSAERWGDSALPPQLAGRMALSPPGLGSGGLGAMLPPPPARVEANPKARGARAAARWRAA